MSLEIGLATFWGAPGRTTTADGHRRSASGPYHCGRSGRAKACCRGHMRTEADVQYDVDMDSSDDESAAPAKKRSKHASAGQSSAVEAPIKILATVQDLERRKTHKKSDWSWTQTKTLREMILGDRHAHSMDCHVQFCD
ncbi:expressed unknown protein [Seminavis robusta]|uniref:Uncharacterized protein n=1 Tax=Seminavis robusta TaxID=568900 RepID=A0A9N8EIQ1_9STRA|nr:expressed unknown protein [Seminavis robusta]|eukprot:Sro1236_g255090.1 n/a (139) ;mRNA; f:8361-8777